MFSLLFFSPDFHSDHSWCGITLSCNGSFSLARNTRLRPDDTGTYSNGKEDRCLSEANDGKGYIFFK